jgi:nitrate reductase / nitrite oxidoreductase, beta subunit
VHRLLPGDRERRQTQCTITCIGKIRLQGFISRPTRSEDNPLDYLIHVRKIAKPLYPQFGLEANVYYIPPVHVPPKYLTQMFGWGVEEAVELYRQAPTTAGCWGRCCCSVPTERIIERFTVRGNYAIGMDRRRCRAVAGAHRRADPDRLDVYRTNVT